MSHTGKAIITSMIAIMLIVACGQTPTAPATAVPLPTLTPVPPTPTRTPTRTPQPTSTSTPTVSPTIVQPPDPFQLVLDVDNLISGSRHHFYTAPDGGLWLITDQGVARLVDGTWRVFLAGFEGELAGIDSSNRLWLVSEDTSEISAWDGVSWTSYGAEAGWLPIGLEDDWYRGAGWGESDSTGRFWLTTTQDVRFFDGSHWSVFTPEDMAMWEVGPEQQWFSFEILISQHSGNVWVGECNWGGPGPFGGAGVRWLDGDTWQGADSPVSSGCTTVLEEDQSGHIWANTDGDLWRYQPASGDWTRFSPPDPPKEMMWFGFADSLTIGPSGDPWPAIVLCGGASCYGNIVLYHLHNGVWTQIGDVAEYEGAPYGLAFSNNANWLSWEHTLYRITADSLEQLTDLNIQSIAVDNDGRLWLAAWVEGRAMLLTLSTSIE